MHEQKSRTHRFIIATALLTLMVLAIASSMARASPRITIGYLGLTTNIHKGDRVISAQFSVTNHSPSNLWIVAGLDDPHHRIFHPYQGCGEFPAGKETKLNLELLPSDLTQREYFLHVILSTEQTNTSAAFSLRAKIREYVDLGVSKLRGQNPSNTITPTGTLALDPQVTPFITTNSTLRIDGAYTPDSTAFSRFGSGSISTSFSSRGIAPGIVYAWSPHPRHRVDCGELLFSVNLIDMPTQLIEFSPPHFDIFSRLKITNETTQSIHLQHLNQLEQLKSP